MRYTARIVRHHASRTNSPRVAHIITVAAALATTPTFSSAQGHETRYVAPTDATVTTSIDEGFGSTPSQVIRIQNASTVSIHVYSVTLRNCENIKQDCGIPFPLNLRVNPGGRATLRRVDPKNTNDGFSFRYSFGWRADSSDVAALHVLADNGVAKAQRELASENAAAAEQKAAVGVHDVDLSSDDIAALGARIVRLRAEPDSISLHVGQLVPMRQMRILAMDAQGELLGRVWAYNFRIVNNLVTMRADTLVAQKVGRTTAEFRLAPPASPITVRVPIIIAAADTTR